VVNRTQRGIAVALVAAAHLCLLWLIVRYGASQATEEPPYAVIRVLPINLPPEVRTVLVKPVEHAAPRGSPRIAPPRLDREPARSTAITLPPEGTSGVDWQREAQLVARSRAEPAVATGKSLQTRPSVLPLPPNREYQPKKGDMTPMRPDGSIGLWTTDEIYCEWREPLMNHFEVWASSIPPHCQKRGKQRPATGQEFDVP
jgi:hypothetical protein